MDKIMEDLSEAGVFGASSRAIFTIQGGYFEADTGLDEFSLATLNRALDIGAEISRINPGHLIKYDLLVNDLGITCNSGYCSAVDLVDQKNTHDSVGVAIKIAGARGVTFRATTERHMRNWGFRKIKKIFRSPDWRVRYPNLISMANEGKNSGY